jgi:hypothetical protein
MDLPINQGVINNPLAVVSVAAQRWKGDLMLGASVTFGH